MPKVSEGVLNYQNDPDIKAKPYLLISCISLEAFCSVQMGGIYYICTVNTM